MRRLSSIPLLLRTLFRRKTVEQELDDELRSHLEDEIQAGIERGLPPEAARQQAVRKLHGAGLYKEQVRDAWRAGLADGIRQDLRYAVRTLLKSPAFATIAILSLALGIGANTAVFSLMDVLLLRPLPVSNPGRLALVKLDEQRYSFSYPLFQQIHDRNSVFSHTFAWDIRNEQTPEGQDLMLVPTVFGSGEFFQGLGVAPQLGRTFGPEDDRPGGGPNGPVVVISDGFWSRRFGRNSSVLGQTLPVNGVSAIVIGVMPAGFFGAEVGTAPDLFVPLNTARQTDDQSRCMDSTSCWFLRVMGRLKDPVSAEEAHANLRVLSRPIMEATTSPGMRADRKALYQSRVIHSEPGKSGFTSLRGRVKDPLRVLMALVAIVLLIACANLANLLTARATARSREIAVRLAMGAGRGRVIRQLLTESLLLALAGAAGGFAFSLWSTRVLIAVLSGVDHAIHLDLHPDWRVLLFSSGAAVAAGILFGLAPAFRATRSGIAAAIRERAHNVRGAESASGFGKVMLGVQVGLSVVLLAAAGLFAGTLGRLLNVDPGFAPDRLATVSIINSRPPLQGPALIGALHRIVERARALPGVEGATLVWPRPLTNSGWNDFAVVPGRPDLTEDQRLTNINVVGTQYVKTVGVTLAAGREFNDGDHAESEKVIMISEGAARRFFPDGSALGRQISVEKNVMRRIVGIVADSRYLNLREETPLVAYLPVAQSNQSGFVAVRSGMSVAALYPMFRHIVHEEVPAMPIGSIVTMRQQIDESLSTERLTAYLSIFIGALALLLTSVGLYGILSYSVQRRTGEIGIRMALGAQRNSVVWLILREAMGHTVAGLAAGIVVVIATSKVVKALLYGVKPNDPATIAAAVGILVLVCIFAASLPARRATRLDPMQALRED